VIEIDGSFGEGGGQIVRSSLALACVAKTPIRITNIRAGRKRSGLLRQHLTCLRAAAEISGAAVTGDQLGSTTATFEPGTIQSGCYRFSISTAGSAALVAQTVLPALMLAEGSSDVTFTGGTHNPLSPPFEFLQKTFLPQLSRMGPAVEAELLSYGFFPAGGGEFRLKIDPVAKLKNLQLTERANFTAKRVTAIVSQLSPSVAERECETIRRRTGWDAKSFRTIEVAKPVGLGNVVLIELETPQITEVIIGYGKAGLRAEQVARSVVRDARSYIASEVPVGEYLADQLLLPMGLSAAHGETSQFRTVQPSLHTTTHVELLKTFLPIEIDIKEDVKDQFLITVRPR
ncbi:UNVERIFIED_CONTAM: hypothetical protein GTU68_038634, partial [Idotea baltica]|nr:hypothetical protein [Idotea baltica]